MEEIFKYYVKQYNKETGKKAFEYNDDMEAIPTWEFVDWLLKLVYSAY